MACDWLAHALLGTFLATLIPELHLLLTGRFLDSDLWYLRIEPVVAWWLPGLLLFVLPSLVGRGGSVGQRSVLLRQVRPDGTDPRTGRRLLRVMLGSGLYALLGGLVALGASAWLVPVLALVVLATVIAVVPTRHHRGLSLVWTGLELADRTRVDRTASNPPPPADEGDPMVEPILVSIATTLATKAAGSLYDLVRKAFTRHRPAAVAELEAAKDAAPDSAPVRVLAERLAEVSAADPEFASQLRAEWARVDVSQQADNGGVTNSITGSVTGKVVQARDIQGGISF
jgi:hypothetical protein